VASAIKSPSSASACLFGKSWPSASVHFGGMPRPGRSLGHDRDATAGRSDGGRFRPFAVTAIGMADFRCSRLEVGDDIDANRAGATAAVTGRIDLAHKGAHILSFTRTDFSEHVPQFRFQPHTGPASLSDDVAINETTDRQLAISYERGDIIRKSLTNCL
jgi:hypothetical protein